VAALPAEALDLRDGDAVHADLADGLAHVVELEWLDDGGDELHGAPAGLYFCMTAVLSWLAARRPRWHDASNRAARCRIHARASGACQGPGIAGKWAGNWASAARRRFAACTRARQDYESVRHFGALQRMTRQVRVIEPWTRN
jgi:hypothetical protein